MNGLLARRAQFTAVFAMSDVIAIGVIRALASAGYKVPDDVSVIGFDGISMSRYCVPALASMVQPTEELATRCVELLLRQIEHGAPARTVVLAPSLQEGEASARPGAPHFYNFVASPSRRDGLHTHGSNQHKKRRRTMKNMISRPATS